MDYTKYELINIGNLNSTTDYCIYNMDTLKIYTYIYIYPGIVTLQFLIHSPKTVVCVKNKTKTKPKTFLRIYLPSPPLSTYFQLSLKRNLNWSGKSTVCTSSLWEQSEASWWEGELHRKPSEKKSTEQRIWVVKTTDIRPKARAVCLSYERISLMPKLGISAALSSFFTLQ